jgi:hypothetical protein
MNLTEKRINQIIDKLDVGSVPTARHPKEAQFINLMLDISSVGSASAEPSPEFINKLENKLLNQGVFSMKKLFNRKISKPAIIGVIATLVLLVGVATSFELPSPVDFGADSSRGSTLELRIDDANTVIDTKRSMVAPVGSVTQGGIGVMPETIQETGVYAYPDTVDLDSPYRYQVKTGQLGLRVKDVDKSLEDSKQYLISIGGIITSSNIQKYESDYYASLNVRVPAADFEAAMSYLKSLALEVETEYSNLYDETSQVNSVADAVTISQDKLSEYRTLLAQTQTTNERLQIQRNIDNLERQLANLEKQLTNLEAKAEMSQISVTFREKSWQDLPFLKNLGLSEVISGASRALLKVVAFLTVLVIWVVVFTPIWLPIWLIVRWLKKRR